ncbi:hypothetical protein [Pedobacter montanisoli]|uniref:Uncharacterized protein n=1 Tax=Pedobacter montanisoli TaxID=2923277 RepID=A0ABS9ZW86_9SPHI|nr:hypothetical protein [Pedobacter montanisoli]MCJ0742578.1 hypothetical protein [Pedobacter montanisoli]
MDRLKNSVLDNSYTNAEQFSKPVNQTDFTEEIFENNMSEAVVNENYCETQNEATKIKTVWHELINYRYAIL